jgi:hypothetical protein
LEQLERRELPSVVGSATDQLRETYGQIPLSFEANQGQTDPRVNFLARGSGYALFLTPDEAVLSLQQPAATSSAPGSESVPSEQDVLRLQLIGASTSSRVIGLDKQEATSNYFLGSDPSRWQSNIANVGRVEYQDVYPGIDLVYYGNQRQLEYDFLVGPGADAGRIQLAFQGAQSVEIDGQGKLVLHTGGGDVVEHAPVVYQDTAGGRQTIGGRYVLEGPGRVGFQVDTYDRSRPLTIDPVLSYSTYLGGSKGDYANGIAVDASRNAYVTGFTYSTNFPTTTEAFQTTNKANDQTVFVTKLDANGTALVYSTYLGGTGLSHGSGIAVDGSGNAYITGDTSATDFPTTTGAFLTTKKGTVNAFVTKLNASGTGLLYSTYLGGSVYY